MGGNSHTRGGWSGFQRAGKKIDARAPQHDPASNKPMSTMTGTNANLGTDAGAWNFMFHGPTSPVSARIGQYAQPAVTGLAGAGTAFEDDTPTGASPYTQPSAPVAAPTPTGAAIPALAAGKQTQAGWGRSWQSSGTNQVIAPKPFALKPASSKWEAPTVMDANQIAAKYSSKAFAMNKWLMQKPLSNG